MTQSSENICENSDVDKKDLNGQITSEKGQFSSILNMIFKFSLARI